MKINYIMFRSCFWVVDYRLNVAIIFEYHRSNFAYIHSPQASINLSKMKKFKCFCSYLSYRMFRNKWISPFSKPSAIVFETKYVLLTPQFLFRLNTITGHQHWHQYDIIQSFFSIVHTESNRNNKVKYVDIGQGTSSSIPRNLHHPRKNHPAAPKLRANTY